MDNNNYQEQHAQNEETEVQEQEKYYSVPEFAKKVGLTPQAIYKRLHTVLQPYVKEFTNCKKISERAIFNVYGVTEEPEVENPVDNNSNEEINNTQQVTTSAAELIELLKEQLNQNSRQLTVLQGELDVKNGQIKELNERLSESQKLLDQQQRLNAISENKLLELEEELNKEAEEHQEKKQNLFSRFFK